MSELTDQDYEDYEEDLKILTDTLRKCFNAEKARYYVAHNQDALFIEIDGLETLDNQTISEVAEEVFAELDLDFDEISLLPYKH
ncbi:MAG: hypothetical protein U5J95_06170 [Balneolaceae bacterium]|nr:hypothetical protein [Balneolaceae bacterium]